MKIKQNHSSIMFQERSNNMSYILLDYVHKGDVIRANDFAEGLDLTVGKEYVVTNVDLYIEVENDLGVKEKYSNEYFTK